MHNIGFRNAYDLFGFWKEGMFEVRDADEIFGVVNAAAEKYRGVIPDDRWREPYMPMEEVREEMKRMRFYGVRKDMRGTWRLWQGACKGRHAHTPRVHALRPLRGRASARNCSTSSRGRSIRKCWWLGVTPGRPHRGNGSRSTIQGTMRHG